MIYHKYTSCFFIISLISGGSITEVYSHELSKNPPASWEFVDNNFYDSISNSSCNLNNFRNLKKKIIKRRKWIKSRNRNIRKLKTSLSTLQSHIAKLSQTILKLENKLSALAFEDKKRKKLISKIKKKQRKISFLQRNTSRKQTLIRRNQTKADLIHSTLIQTETLYGELNADCASLAGVWQSQGYGYVVDILGQRFTSYDVTSTICIKNKSFDQKESFFDDYDLYQFTDNNRKIRVAVTTDLPYELTFRRINALPSQCLQPIKNTPAENLESFANFFQEHYPFFDLYGVDWDIETSYARNLVNKNTSDQELLDIFSGMLNNVKDGHILLEATIEGDEVEFDAHPFDIDLAIAQYARKNNIDLDEADDIFLENYLIQDIKNHILGGKLFSDSEEVVFYGMTRNKIGYIAITAEEVIGDTPLEDIELTNAFMDHAINYFKRNNAKAVIVDLSINYGGFDSVSRTIAERFASQRTIGYSKRTGDFSNANDVSIIIEPSSREQYLGPVYLVTSEATISAGEILVLSLRALPNVTHVGEPTNGALSDQLEKELSNGWNISFSNEIYTDNKGIRWESFGIDPEIQIPIFDLNNPMGSAHRDAIDALINLINEEHQ